MAKEKTKPTKVEIAKQNSQLLRGSIDETLNDPEIESFGEDDLQLLKFHGSYEQDDRDLRKSRRAEGLGKAYSYMLRVVLPAGQITNAQYIDLDRMADDFANGSIRLTTRQAIQYHGIIKGELRETIRQINESLMTTLAACGDVCRNVMATAAPLKDPIHTQIRETALEVAAELKPATNAYHEIWVEGKRQLTSQESSPEIEPLYGETYLPRKYKVGVTVQGDNQMDIYSYDVGLIGIVENGQLVGWNVVAGGGLGMSHGRPNTFAQLADKIGFIAIEDGVAATRVIATIYRDFGNRFDRKTARLKYLIDKMGVDTFCEEFKRRCEFDVHASREIPDVSNEDWLGKHAQGDGKFFYGVFVENGRIKDTFEVKLRTAFLKIIKRLGCSVTLTPQQSILFNELTESQIVELESILVEHNVKLLHEISNARRYSMACPALPTCGLAVSESERVMPAWITEIENRLETMGLGDTQLTIRMTGCPNGCSRPYTADIALVGRRPGIYHLFVGGRLAGDRMADLYAADIKIEDAIATLMPLLTKFAETRHPDEGFGDFYQRIRERTEPRRRVTGKETPTFDDVQPKLVQIEASP